MLTFLRKIRKSLIDSGRSKSYLLYASGEIFLVMIDILLALQINNWNEHRKDRIQEDKVLSSLLEDFRYSQSRLSMSLEAFDQEILRLESSIRMIGLKHENLTDDMKNKLGESGYRNTALAEGTLNSILNTNKLELITNDTLKSLLTAYPAEITKFKNQALNVKNIVLNIHRPVLEKYVSLTTFISEDIIKFPDLNKHAYPSDFDGLLKDRFYQNALVDRLLQTGNLHFVARNFLARTDRIIGLIEKELN
tara:strand:- start:2550 stop:3299 length:750 start_codon:yes stop_codon:yes gene_type:complete